MIDRRIGKIKVRRGTNLQRKPIVFEDGEIVYTIDTKRAFIGDDTTQGGNVISNINYITNVAGLPSNVEYGDIVHVETTKNTYIVGYDLDGVTLKLILISAGNISDDLQKQIDDLYNQIKPLTGCLTPVVPPPPPVIPFEWVIEPVDQTYPNRLVINAEFTAKARGPYNDIVYTWEKLTAGTTTTTTTIIDNTLLITHGNDLIVTHGNDNFLIKSESNTTTTTTTDPLIENWIAIPRAIGEKLTIIDAQPSDIGYYRCIATSKAGRLVSVRAKLDIQSIEFKWSVQPVSYSTVIDTLVEFTAEAYNTFGGTITYQWYKDDIIISGATSKTYSILRAFIPDKGKYKCVATTVYKGTPESITSNIVDLDVQNIVFDWSIQPVSYSTIDNSPAQFTAEAYNKFGGTITYQWYKDDIIIAGATSKTYSIAKTAISDKGKYKCVAFATYKGTPISITSNIVDLDIQEFKWSVQPVSYSTTNNSPAQFTAEAYNTFGETITYQWYKDDIIIAGATSKTYSITNTAISDKGKYKCVATTAYKGTPISITSDIVDLDVQNIVFEWSVQPVSNSIKNGLSAQFTAEAYNTFGETITYQWYKDDIIIAGATSKTYSITNTAISDKGKYKCVATTAYKGTPISITSDIVDLDIVIKYFDNVKAIAATTHRLFLKNDDTVWSIGRNNRGQVGDGTIIDRYKPVQISGLTNVKDIAVGYEHSLFLKNDGIVWSCGYNEFGQLGNGKTIDSSIPVQVSGLTNVKDIAAGREHSLFLKNDGTVWGCGNGMSDQIPILSGLRINKIINATLTKLTNIKAIAGGNSHSLFLKNDGTVLACGWNAFGQLGNGKTIDSAIPVQVSGLKNVIAIAAGYDSSLFLKNDGTVWGCGNNAGGQLGNGKTIDSSIPVQVSGLTNVKAIHINLGTSLFLKNDGTVWGCGLNTTGQLGNGNTINSSIPVQISGLTNVIDISYITFLKNDSIVWNTGSGSLIPIPMID